MLIKTKKKRKIKIVEIFKIDVKTTTENLLTEILRKLEKNGYTIGSSVGRATPTHLIVNTERKNVLIIDYDIKHINLATKEQCDKICG